EPTISPRRSTMTAPTQGLGEVRPTPFRANTSARSRNISSVEWCLVPLPIQDCPANGGRDHGSGCTPGAARLASTPLALPPSRGCASAPPATARKILGKQRLHKLFRVKCQQVSYFFAD